MEAKEFVPIRVSTLRGDLKITFDAYVKVAGKHILYCRKGDSFEGERLNRLKAKKIKKMYIASDDERDYRKYMSQNIELAYDKSVNKPIEIRAEVIQGAQQAAAEDIMEDPESKAFYDVVKDGSTRYVDFIKKEAKALSALMNIKNVEQSISHHGVTVATLAVGMAQKLGIIETHPVNLLVLGCLLHDIEHFHIPLPLHKKKEDMELEEQALYELHPLNGVERAKKCSFYDQIVLNIIFQHEEFIDRSGFPRGLSENEIDPMALIAATANSYDRFVSFYGLNSKDALKELLIGRMGLHPLSHMQALQDVLKLHNIV